MSMAVLEKGGKPAATRQDGICPISWSSDFLRSFLQVMHFEVRALDMLRTLIIQYFLLTSWIKLLYPQCPRLSCRWRSNSLTSRWSRGRITGFLISCGKDLASSSRP